MALTKCGFNQTLCDTAVKRTNSNCGKCVERGEEDRFCVDRKWKNLCYEDHVLQCKTNSNCVHESWINDNEDDCMDGSDEIKCPTPNCEKSKPTAGHHTHSTGNREPEHEGKPTEFPCDCSEIMRSHPGSQLFVSSTRIRSPAGKCPFFLLCDFELFGGGWTTVMHRQWPTSTALQQDVGGLQR
ncbi:Lipophorin receptor [Aphelenchoides fujianensis]|nr:Lipophorin receptor [Aphelenchoides fujianensis]